MESFFFIHFLSLLPITFCDSKESCVGNVVNNERISYMAKDLHLHEKMMMWCPQKNVNF